MRAIKLLLILVISLAFRINVNSQVTQQWASRYNGPGNGDDISYFLAIDAAGNVYVTGASLTGGTNFDYATVKYNSAGIQQWAARYDGPGNAFDEPSSIAVDNSGNVYVTGWSTGNGTDYDYATIKYNSSGVQQWAARYDGPGTSADISRSLAVDGFGNVYITGQSVGSGTLYDYTTLKYNSAGVQQWAARYNGPGNGADAAYALAIDGFGNAYVTGGSYRGGSHSDFATIKYNSSGVEKWVARYIGPANTPSFDHATSIAFDLSGNVYVTGMSTSNTPQLDYATLKYDSNGTQQWVKRYNESPTADARAYSIAVDSSGNVYVTGQAFTNNNNYATVKYNASGDYQWDVNYNGPGNGDDRAYSLVLDRIGNVYVTGQSFGSGTFNDYATIKYNSAGVQQWVERYNGPGNDNDEAQSLAVDSMGNVYLAGGSIGTGTSYDYAIIKYSPVITEVQQVSNEIPDRFSLLQNFPNPFNPATKINFGVAKSSFVNITVYDIAGREIKTLINETKQAGYYTAEFDGTNLASGIYIYRIKTDSFIATKKMVLLK